MGDEPWVSDTLREAAQIIFDDGHNCAIGRVHELLFSLADRAEKFEKNGLSPVRDRGWGIVFSNAVIFAVGVVKEAEENASL